MQLSWRGHGCYVNSKLSGKTDVLKSLGLPVKRAPWTKSLTIDTGILPFMYEINTNPHVFPYVLKNDLNQTKSHLAFIEINVYTFRILEI